MNVQIIRPDVSKKTKQWSNFMLFPFTVGGILNELENEGIIITTSNPDCVLIHLHPDSVAWFHHNKKFIKKPVVVFERFPSPCFHLDSWVFLDNKVVSIWKESLYKEKEDYFHYESLSSAVFKAEQYKTKPQKNRNISSLDVIINKLVLGFNVGISEKIFRCVEYTKDKGWNNKLTDVCFVGGITGGLGSGIYPLEHRKLCIRKMQSLNGVCSLILTVPNQPISYYKYLNYYLGSKVSVSPWGFGEVCFRDFEALLCGCILIKPRTDFLRTYPDIYSEDFCVWCNSNFSDLQEKIDLVLNNYEYYLSKVKNAVNYIKYCMGYKNIAKQIKGAFSRL